MDFWSFLKNFLKSILYDSVQNITNKTNDLLICVPIVVLDIIIAFLMYKLFDDIVIRKFRRMILSMIFVFIFQCALYLLLNVSLYIICAITTLFFIMLLLLFIIRILKN